MRILSLQLFAILAWLLSSQIATAQLPATLPDSGNPDWIAECGQPGKAGYDACENLADQHLKGTGVPASSQMTAYYLLKACRYGNLEMCEYAIGSAKGAEESVFITGEASAILCENGRPQFCALVYADFSDEEKPHYNPNFAGVFIEKGCQQGFATACKWMASWFNDIDPKEGVTPSLEKEVFALTQTCNMDPATSDVEADDVSSSCYLLHRQYSGDEALPADLEKSGSYLSRSCEFGDANTCEYALSSFHHGVNGVSKDEAEAGQMAQYACDLDSKMGCSAIAQKFSAQGNHAQAFSAFARLCDADRTQYDCVGAMTSAYHAKGDEHADTTRYAKASCELDSGYGCHLYASNTFWLDSNFNRHLFQKACKLGYDAGCREVSRQEAQAERNAAIDQRNKEMIERQMRPPAPSQSQPTWDDYMRQGNEYWSNWKPSYCKHTNRREGLSVYNSRAECTDD